MRPGAAVLAGIVLLARVVDAIIVVVALAGRALTLRLTALLLAVGRDLVRAAPALEATRLGQRIRVVVRGHQVRDVVPPNRRIVKGDTPYGMDVRAVRRHAIDHRADPQRRVVVGIVPTAEIDLEVNVEEAVPELVVSGLLGNRAQRLAKHAALPQTRTRDQCHAPADQIHRHDLGVDHVKVKVGRTQAGIVQRIIQGG